MPDNALTAWGAVGAVGSAIATFTYATFVLLTLFVIRRQLYAAVILPVLFHSLDSPSALRKRAQLYDSYCDNPTQPITSQQLHHIRGRVIYDFSRLGMLLHRGFLSKHVVTEWLHDVPIKLWIILMPSIDAEISRRQ